MRHVEPPVRDVEQRLPAVGATFFPCLPGIRGEHLADSVQLAGHRQRIDVAPGNIRELLQQLLRGPLPGRVVLPVMQCRESQELVGALLRGVERSTDLLAVGGAAVLVDQLQMPDDPGPAWEAVTAGDHQLGIGQRLHWMEFGGERHGVRVGIADLLEQRLRLLAQVVQVRVVRKIPGRHRDLLSTSLLSASSGEKGGEHSSHSFVNRWAEPFPRTGGTLRAYPEA